MRTTAYLASLLCLAASTGAAPTIYRHGWDTVADVMGMHGKFKSADVQPNDEVRRVCEDMAFLCVVGCAVSVCVCVGHILRVSSHPPILSLHSQSSVSPSY